MWLRKWLIGPIVLGFIVLVAWSVFFRKDVTPPQVACHFGAYSLEDGRIIVFSATGIPKGMRFALMSGETGRLRPAASQSPSVGTGAGVPAGRRRMLNVFEGGAGWASDSPVVHRVAFEGCGAPGVVVSLDGGQPLKGTRLAFDTAEVTFQSHGLNLAGRLVMPKGTQAVPVAVQVHGSERDAALLNNRFQHFLPANGIGVFVYDKRGTGQSEGSYTQDFHLLSDDANAALAAARKVAGRRALEVGFQGGSQAGWVIPLAATKAKADFLLVGFGLAEGPVAEDRDEVFDNLRRAGYGEDVIAKAREVVAATAAVMRSDFRDGFEKLDAVRAKYGAEPWFGVIKGEYSGDLLSTPNWMIRLIGPVFDVGTSWEYEPRPALEACRVPHLWVLAGQDTEAPSIETLKILRSIQAGQPELDVVTFPDADHGILEVSGQGNERLPVRFSEGYFQLVVDWIHTKRLPPRAGSALMYPGSSESVLSSPGQGAVIPENPR